MKSKTTILGVLGILSAVVGALTHLLSGLPIDWNATAAAVATSLGLIFASDQAKSA